MKRFLSLKILIILVAAGVLGFVATPQKYQPEWSPDFVKNMKVHLGLDLQGGSQLDYKIDLRRVPLEDRESIIDGVTEVINRRVNNLGVSEPNIYVSEVAGENHIIVELAGIKNLEEAKQKIGKTVQLEFKEERTAEDPEHKTKIRQEADNFLQKVLKENKFELLGEEEAKAFPSYAKYESGELKFKEDFIDGKLFDKAMTYKTGDIVPELVEGTYGFTIQGSGQESQLIPNEGFFAAKIADKKENAEKQVKEPKKVYVRHALISYKGAERAGDITRTKGEAELLAKKLREQINKGEKTLEEIAKTESNEPNAGETGGKLEQPVQEDGTTYVKKFTDAALKLKESELSDVVETEFGFHIIQAEKVEEAVDKAVTEPQLHLNYIFFSTLPDPWQETELTGEHFSRADVEFDQLYQPYVTVSFTDEGAELFEQITERNVEKPLAIFVGGDLISAPTVRQKITGGSAIITGSFSVTEATELARDLNTGAIPAPISLAGQYTIGASLGQDALAKSILAGLIGLMLLALYMILYYRLPGFLSVISLAIYSLMLIFVIKIAMPLAIALTISVLLFIVLVIKLMNSQDSGWDKFVSFVLACFILFFFSFLLSTPVVVTLAGVAGIILSIGMAVDANVLIFERMKEELRDGRPLSAAIEIGFQRAWSSIRDGNFSTLITCAILAYFGSSIIRGFALNLAAGVLLSMFTAITITRAFLTRFVGTKMGENAWLFGKVGSQRRSPFKIIERSKFWLTLSGIVIAAGIFGIVVRGVNLGIDFRGGTLLQLKFEKEMTHEDIRETLQEVETKLKDAPTADPAKPPAPAIPEFKEEIRITKFGSPVIVSAGENEYIIRMEYITETEHEEILQALKEKFGTVEESRFTTIGPLIGDALKKKAIMAIGIALLAIILYIAFAFRHVPKRINPWRFGVCAIVALAHDIFIIFGIFTLLGLEIDALFITALLAILGLSVNDTIVVFDRIRENLKTHGGDDFDHVANKSLTDTMARSFNTSFSTFITVGAIFVFGSPSVHNFILALLIGIIVGTYSSIFTASPLLAFWNRARNK